MSASSFDKAAKQMQLVEIFTPNAPIQNLISLKGRSQQEMQMVNALSQTGMHAVMYGERGVGKTSLANNISELISQGARESVPTTCRINCTTNDNFRSICQKILRELELEIPESWMIRNPDPDDVRFLLQNLSTHVIIVLDEFDRVEDDEALSLIADTIKALSDHAVRTKLVIVGVADSLEELVGEHESIQRCIHEISVPRMSIDEILEIIDFGINSAQMTFDPNARMKIARLSEGLPHYAHSLALRASQYAVWDDRLEVRTADVKRAIDDIISSHVLALQYKVATESSRSDAIFQEVLVSCALAHKDTMGYFSTRAVGDELEKLLSRRPQYSSHLGAFAGSNRGNVLQRKSSPHGLLFRFSNPLLQPFAIMVALSTGLVPESVLEEETNQ